MIEHVRFLDHIRVIQFNQHNQNEQKDCEPSQYHFEGVFVPSPKYDSDKMRDDVVDGREGGKYLDYDEELVKEGTAAK
jgi:hypothetical protein